MQGHSDVKTRRMRRHGLSREVFDREYSFPEESVSILSLLAHFGLKMAMFVAWLADSLLTIDLDTPPSLGHSSPFFFLSFFLSRSLCFLS
ncbi:hypothetical protein CSUI_004443 [Cystoisospora suis]|uniref:Transmembrane protein n=1 Tax=Cystoisospora suis TaxID=483139 RepID=A0A2C6KYR5_9APIC|nr:hypothetical protein CSUI_004443 [Cystoisospora suis]